MAECYACGVNTELVQEMGKVIEAADALVGAASIKNNQEEVVCLAADLRMAVFAYRATVRRFNDEEEINAVQ